MEGAKRAYVISNNGKVVAVAESATAAQRYALWRCIEPDFLGARFRWTHTHKLFAQRIMTETWTWTGIEITPTPLV